MFVGWKRANPFEFVTQPFEKHAVNVEPDGYVCLYNSAQPSPLSQPCTRTWPCGVFHVIVRHEPETASLDTLHEAPFKVQLRDNELIVQLCAGGGVEQTFPSSVLPSQSLSRPSHTSFEGVHTGGCAFMPSPKDAKNDHTGRT